jgi:FtsZ-interacting cell division protein ZipA
MDTNTIVWIIIGVVVVIAIVAIVIWLTSRKRREAQVEAGRRKAEDLRAQAYESDVAARERQASAEQAQAEAKRADADAQEAAAQAERARLESERLAREGAGEQTEAAKYRTESQDHLREAATVDPDAHNDGDRRGATERAGHDTVGGQRDERFVQHDHDRSDTDGEQWRPGRGER